MTYETKESRKKKKKEKEKTPDISIPSCPTRGEAPFPTKPRIPSVNNRIGHGRSNSRLL
jgi:hypothetical protein